MKRANARQIIFLLNLKKFGDEQHEEWVARKREGDEDAGDSHSIKVRLAPEKKYQKFVYLTLSGDLTECLEAGWIEPWPEWPAKYAITQPGLTQLKIAQWKCEEQDNIPE